MTERPVLWNRAWWNKGCAGGYAQSDLPSVDEIKEAERLDREDYKRALGSVESAKQKGRDYSAP